MLSESDAESETYSDVEVIIFYLQIFYIYFSLKQWIPF